MVSCALLSHIWAKSQVKSENASVISLNNAYSIVYNINALLTVISLIFSLFLYSFFNKYMFIILAFTILSYIKAQKTIGDKLIDLKFQEISRSLQQHH